MVDDPIPVTPPTTMPPAVNPDTCIEVFNSVDPLWEDQDPVPGDTLVVCDDLNASCNMMAEHGVCTNVTMPNILYYRYMYGADCDPSENDDADDNEIPTVWDCAW